MKNSSVPSFYGPETVTKKGSGGQTFKENEIMGQFLKNAFSVTALMSLLSLLPQEAFSFFFLVNIVETI